MRTLVVLDFDGVICDSLQECLASSWYAYYHLLLGLEPSSTPLTLRSRFASLRPFVRAGEDFLLLQEIIHLEVPIGSQGDFDAYARRSSGPRLKRLGELFYEARSRFLRCDRESWLALNRIYPGLRHALSAWVLSPAFYILSTKKPEFILEILASKGIESSAERVLYCARKGKLDIVSELLDRLGAGGAVFVDDQIDHLLSGQGGDNRIEARLASWGYIQPEWLEEKAAVKTLSLEEALGYLEPLIRAWE